MNSSRRKVLQKSVGNKERLLRAVLGVAIIALDYYFKSWFIIVGVMLIFNALTGWCGIYHILGISTCLIKKEDK